MFKLKTVLHDEAGTDGGEAGGAAPAAPAAEPAPAPAAAETNTPPAGYEDLDKPLEYEDISAMLSFDPFEKPDEPAPGSEEQPAQSAATTDVPPEAGGEIPVKPEPTAQPADGVPQENPELVLLKQQLAELQAQNAQMQQQQQLSQQQQQQAAPGADPLERFIPPYQFQIPEQMMTMLDSENPQERAQALSTLMSGALRTAHKTMLQQVNGMMQTYVPHQMQQFQQQQQFTSSVQNDFYSEYQDLNTPEIRQIVASVTPQVMQELGVSNWSPVLRDAIANKVKGMLHIGAAPAATPPAAPPAQFTPGSRGPVADPNNVTNQIMDLM